MKPHFICGFFIFVFMKKLFGFVFFFSCFAFSQSVKFVTLLDDDVSIRAINICDNKVWYAGTHSKFGFVDLENPENKQQLKLSEEQLQFRTLAQDKDAFYTINIESPARFFKIDKKTLTSKIIFTDTVKTAFYDALHFSGKEFYTFSDPKKDLNLRFLKFLSKKKMFKFKFFDDVKLHSGEAAFAASNTNIASTNDFLWIATGGKVSRIIKMDLKTQKFEVFETPFIQGESSQGIYSIDFLDNRFGIAVGGDYTKQNDNINNIATTYDGGKTWEIQASGKNAGYMTCVRIKPNTNGKEILAIGDQNISYSKDFGKTWTKISSEKGFYVAQWLSPTEVILAGKNKISKMIFTE